MKTIISSVKRDTSFLWTLPMYIAPPPELCNALFMDETVRAELDKLTELIINAIPVEQIYLFGSYAYGTPHKYSDEHAEAACGSGRAVLDLRCV
jgi:DNA polymerase sigma